MADTVKLFNEDPYLVSFKATVVKVEGKKVELDQTAFYPEGGGQLGDTGVIAGVRVVNTQKDNGTIQHILEAPPAFGDGDEVDCEVDWDRRYRIMKLHSAAHIMEHFLWQRIGKIDRVGSRVDEKKDRADYVYEGRLPVEDLAEAQVDANIFLSEGHEITISPDPTDPEIRIWRCGPVEMPCGGTHVRNTSEIGAIKLKRKNPGKGVERVETSLA
jgi:alanyl-tRNA synthetase